MADPFAVAAFWRARARIATENYAQPDGALTPDAPGSGRMAGVWHLYRTRMARVWQVYGCQVDAIGLTPRNPPPIDPPRPAAHTAIDLRGEPELPADDLNGEEARIAYAVAEERIAQAKAERWRFLNLSAEDSLTTHFGESRAGDETTHFSESRAGDERLAALTLLPPGTAELTALDRLNLDYTQVADLQPLAGLTALQHLDLARTHVTELQPLAKLTALRSLDLGMTHVTKLQPLAKLTTLENLNLSYSQVEDLQPLAGLNALKYLYLNDTQVADLQPLVGLTALRHLWFQNIPACAAVPELKALSKIHDMEECTRKTLHWLRANAPEPIVSPLRDFYISFTKADMAHANAIDAHLTTAGYTTFLHTRDNPPGGDIIRWMNQSLKHSKRVLALATADYFADAAVFSAMERNTTRAMDPTGDEARLVLVELKPTEYDPIYLALHRITTTSGLSPEDAAKALLADLQSRDARGRAKPWNVSDKFVLRAGLPNTLDDFTESLEVAQSAAAALSEALKVEGVADHPLAKTVDQLRRHLDRPPDTMKADRVMALHLLLVDAVGLQKHYVLQRHNAVLSAEAAGALDTAALATRHLLREMPGGREAEAEALERQGGDPERAEAVFDAMDGSAAVDDDSVEIVRMFVALVHQGEGAGAAAACHLTDLIHNFQIALGNAANELRRTQAESNPAGLENHFVIRFIREHGTVLADFAAHNVPRGKLWWGIIADLADPDRWRSAP